MLFRLIFVIIVSSMLAACSDNTPPPPSTDNSVHKSKAQLIPRSMEEKANYYLIALEKEGAYLKATHSRISTMSQGFSHTLINCQSQRYQVLGYGEGNIENIKMYKRSPWTDLVKGSSKSDLVSFVCSKQ